MVTVIILVGIPLEVSLGMSAMGIFYSAGIFDFLFGTLFSISLPIALAIGMLFDKKIKAYYGATAERVL